LDAAPVAARVSEGGQGLVTTKDPTWGNADAPVTIIEFSDFECPFCARVEGTLEALQQKYGPQRLRIVWKNDPLPFHSQARPAHEAAMMVFTLGGADAFWKFHHLALAHQRELSPDNYLAWAVAAGVDGQRFQSAFASGQQSGESSAKVSAKVSEDMALANQLGFGGTPAFSINGITLMGAQPGELFEEIIDNQLAAAKLLLSAGLPTSQVYAELCKRNAEAAASDAAEDDKAAEAHADEPERKQVAAPTANNPSKGDPKARVTVQIFSDFQCPYCLLVNPTLAQIEKDFPGRVRFVWRNFPLPFHDHAALAAEAAQEVFAQKGAAGFWQYHDRLFGAQDGSGQGRETLEKLAQEQGLAMKRFRAALDSHKHRAAVMADVVAATQAGIRGTPSFLINGYFIGGAQPVATFERIITRALAESDQKSKP
jgi:protein-disulfide isomerase